MNELYSNNDWWSYLAHHGREGQKWHVRNGPPYPLNRQTVTRVYGKSGRLNEKTIKGPNGYNSIAHPKTDDDYEMRELVEMDVEENWEKWLDKHPDITEQYVQTRNKIYNKHSEEENKLASVIFSTKKSDPKYVAALKRLEEIESEKEPLIKKAKERYKEKALDVAIEELGIPNTKENRDVIRPYVLYDL